MLAQEKLYLLFTPFISFLYYKYESENYINHKTEHPYQLFDNPSK